MKSSRTLTLRTEALTDLTVVEIARLAGASGLTCTGWCQSDFQQCFTGRDCVPTVNDCVVTLDTVCA